MELFSVLLPVYRGDNLAHFKLAVESVLSQTLRPDEIVIIRDGLVNDDLESYLIDIEQNNQSIKVIRFPENKGIIAALNAGMEFCTNDLIARQDADDISKPNRFSEQIPLFASKPNLAIVGSWIDEFEEKVETTSFMRKVPLDRASIVSYSNTRNPFNHMTLVFRKSVIQKVGGYEGIDLFEDWDLWLRVLKEENNEVKNLGISLVYARVGNGLISRRSGLSYAKKELKFLGRALKRGLISPWYTGIWILRIGSRFFPEAILKKVYNKILRWQN